MDEQLANNLQFVEKGLEKTTEQETFEPLTEITKIDKAPEKTFFSDTLIFNNQENENEEYRQITSVKNIAGNYYRITVRKSKIESEDLLETLALVTVLSMLLLTVTLIIVNRRIAKSVWQPFYNNLKSIEQFSVNDKKPVLLHSTGITEFEQLNSAITNLTGQIVSDFQNQKQFSEDISHELQTPLAIIASQIEALLNDNALQEKHSEKLNSIFNSAQRLTKINKSIILLSKIENNQFYSDEETNLTQLITEKLEEFSELIKLKKLTLETELHNDLIVPIPQTLAEVLLNNLISNSINHNVKGGKIKIEILKNQLKICNSGLTEINQPERIFARFYKGDPSSTSVGLGLAIAKKICDLYHINIEYHFNESSHCFALHC